MAQDQPIDPGVYYMPSSEKPLQVMQPSFVLNEIIEKF